MCTQRCSFEHWHATRFYIIVFVVDKILSGTDSSWYIQKWPLLDFTNKMAKREFIARGLFPSLCNSNRKPTQIWDALRPPPTVGWCLQRVTKSDTRRPEESEAVGGDLRDQRDFGQTNSKMDSDWWKTYLPQITWIPCLLHEKRCRSRACRKLWNHCTNAKWRSCSIIKRGTVMRVYY